MPSIKSTARRRTFCALNVSCFFLDHNSDSKNTDLSENKHNTRNTIRMSNQAMTTLSRCLAVSLFVASVFAEKWVEVGSQLECDNYAGDVYLESSRGKVATLGECKKLCEDAKSGKNVSYFKTK